MWFTLPLGVSGRVSSTTKQKALGNLAASTA